MHSQPSHHCSVHALPVRCSVHATRSPWRGIGVDGEMGFTQAHGRPSWPVGTTFLPKLGCACTAALGYAGHACWVRFQAHERHGRHEYLYLRLLIHHAFSKSAYQMCAMCKIGIQYQSSLFTDMAELLWQGKLQCLSYMCAYLAITAGLKHHAL